MRGGIRTEELIEEASKQLSNEKATFTHNTSTLFYQCNLSGFRMYSLSTCLFVVDRIPRFGQKYIV